MLIKFKDDYIFLPQVALRIRPLSDAEQEEAATTVAHRVDDQVRWPSFTLLLCVCVCVSSLFASVHIQYACQCVSDGVSVCVLVRLGAVSELSSCLS